MVALRIEVKRTPDGFWAIHIGTEVVDVCEERAHAEREAAYYRKNPDAAAHEAYLAQRKRERRTAEAVEIERLTRARS